MLAADHHRQLARFQNFGGPGLDVVQGQIGVPEAKLQVAAVKYSAVRQILIQIRAVGFQAKGFGAHGLAGEPGPRPKRGSGVKGRPEQDDPRVLEGRVAA